MKTVLLAWELGGTDSLLRLGAVGAALRQSGWQTVYALRDLVAAAALLPEPAPRCFQAPIWTKPMPRSERPFGPSSYGDQLAIYGYADPDSLGAMLAGWDSLLGSVSPALVIADNAPTLCLAVAGTVPAIAIGDGFSLPPAHLPAYPPLHPHLPPLVAEARLLDTIAAVQRKRGRAPPPALPAILATPFRALCTVPPLDPYAAVRAEPAYGPLGPREAPRP
ncbi:MAG: hypothetical protein KIT16_06160, partial [Rhodospirillaceae bacterium]|nr:hypothetical protein [Rhodospirillaceae bacterium]